ncbi:DUF6221 family protein [Phytoactinopolyspora limicola]|uniref:DUF6221 family protein n=1 Tax=Phytoactinopolyspora limicola TaxID=2715536 RepID=UPI001407F07F|nr:DUF6221 family protein [Phytoactinopolyspora limicola]
MAESELAAFLHARLDELESAAMAAAHHSGGLHWGVEPSGDVVLEALPGEDPPEKDDPYGIAPFVGEFEGAGWHVALHSPARVIAAAQAKRALVDQCLMWQRDAAVDPQLAPLASVADTVLATMARAWAHHADYQPVWSLP